MKEKDSVHHMHIELTLEQYATLCAKAKKSGLTKRAFIVRLLEGQEIRERPTEEICRLREESSDRKQHQPDCPEHQRGNRHQNPIPIPLKTCKFLSFILSITVEEHKAD